MKTTLKLLALVAVAAGAWYGASLYNKTREQSPMQTEQQAEYLQTHVIEHATGILEWTDGVVYFDPVGSAEAFAKQPVADIVLVTDIHGDHFSTSTLEAVVGGNVMLVVPQAVYEQLPPALAVKAKVLANGESVAQSGFTIAAIPMYNLPMAENAQYHTKGRGNGYIVEHGGMRVYIAGDTAGTPEMRALQNINLAFVPMNMPYTMTVEEAADAVLAFKPQTVYPYHYRGTEGLADVDSFKQLVNAGNPSIRVVLADWYPQ